MTQHIVLGGEVRDFVRDASAQRVADMLRGLEKALDAIADAPATGEMDEISDRLRLASELAAVVAGIDRSVAADPSPSGEYPLLGSARVAFDQMAYDYAAGPPSRERALWEAIIVEIHRAHSFEESVADLECDDGAPGGA